MFHISADLINAIIADRHRQAEQVRLTAEASKPAMARPHLRWVAALLGLTMGA